MNESILQKRWQDVLEQSPEFEAAKFAALRDQVARKIKFTRQREQAVGDPARMAEVLSEERHSAGTGRGEIQLETLKQHHATRVRDYISTARDKQRDMASRNGVAQRYSEDPDFATHQPWTDFTKRFAVGMAPAAMVETARENARRNGTPFTDEQEFAALKAQRAQLVPQDVADRYSADKTAQLAAFDRNTADKAKADFRATRTNSSAQDRVDLEQSVNRGESPASVLDRPAPPPKEERINVRDFQFNWGGTIERNGETRRVAPGIGPNRPAVPYDQTPAEFVAPRATRPGVQRQASAYPTIRPYGRSRASATLA